MTCYLSCLALLLMVSMVSCAPTVRVSRSTFIGVDANAFQTGIPYHVYYGIPFAEPPVGDLRFRAPVPYDNTREPGRVFNEQTSECVQQVSSFNSNEDCLYLNIFTPVVGQNNSFDTISLKKVIVYVHGGGFRFGSASVLPSANVATDFDVIFVTIQYRLGLLGFLSSGDDALPGNNGLLDQVVALQWVQDNIRSFGGDPNDVTVSGCSAGATSLSLLSISPLGQGLFTKAILESGTALSPWGIDRNYLNRFYMLAERTNCLPGDHDNRTMSVEYHNQIVDCLRDVEVFQLDSILNRENVPSPEVVVSMDSNVFFAPVVDGFVIPNHPSELMNDVEYLTAVGTLDRKYMVGVVNNEGLTFVYGFYSQSDRLAPTEAFLNPDSPGARAIIRHNLRHFFSCPITEECVHIASLMYYYPRDANGYSSLQTTADFMSDIDYVVPAVSFARGLAAASSDDMVYLYVFDFYPTLADPQFPLQGAGHGISQAFFFDGDNRIFDLFSYANVSIETRNSLSNITRGMAVNLAKDGNPSLPGRIQWPAYSRTNEYYMAISETPEVRQHMYARRVSMWLDLLPQLLSANAACGTGHP